jgi:hypothetical protein
MLLRVLPSIPPSQIDRGQFKARYLDSIVFFRPTDFRTKLAATGIQNLLKCNLGKFDFCSILNDPSRSWCPYRIALMSAAQSLGFQQIA